MASSWSKPEIDNDIFDRLADKNSPDHFIKFIRNYYFWFLSQANLEPTIISASRLTDCWRMFRHDRKRAEDNFSRRNKENIGPDHFKQSGILVFWLRRFAPLVDIKNIIKTQDGINEEKRKIYVQYPSELVAFDIGLVICTFFEGGKKIKLNTDYLQAMVYVMKVKNLSPHSLGMIYRSLFI